MWLNFQPVSKNWLRLWWRWGWRGVLFPSPVKNLGSCQLKSLPQYFYSSKDGEFMKNFLSIPFWHIHSHPSTQGQSQGRQFPEAKFFSKRPVFWKPALYKAGWQPWCVCCTVQAVLDSPGYSWLREERGGANFVDFNFERDSEKNLIIVFICKH